MLRYLCILCVGIVLGEEVYESTATVYNELPCILANGVCIQDSCPSKSLDGFCPTQQSNGVNCCLSVSANQCHKHQGECFPKDYNCPAILTFNDATDCGEDETCCILVH